ncbi:RNA-dependent RNA polymerase [Golden shiner totivirus]|uniref:RNA-dependent RNA polymerase n=1 Tax=Golden shiner totivirus TaxID=1856030 RepID=UPI0007DD460B|nr:RNA-dependent RNA polymerase [Golden shiner totivirus]ANH79339.1 RNA-dependent RNA polymerase [Golden shiner totivirus]
MSNITIYLIIHGAKWFKYLKELGIFANYKTFSVLSRTLGSSTKFMNMKLDLKQKFVELNCLLGYQQLPFEGDGVISKGFDYFAEIKSLATGGNPHGLIDYNWDLQFLTSLKEISKDNLHEKRDYITFENYVKDGKWITAGSSSIGHVDWEFDSESGKFKARKNMLTNIYTRNEIWEIIKDWDGKIVSRAIIKGEMSKIRLAVASNIQMYIYESYLMYLSGHVYKDWFGITLDQSTNENLNENIKIRNLCKENKYILPFDYAAFDHQATTKEIQLITDYYFKLGLKNVPEAEKKFVSNLITKTVNAYGNSEISGEYKKEKINLKITGGLPSGIRTTSLIGNIWNSVLTNLVKNLSIAVLGYNPILNVSLRGDDSLIICNKPQECYLIRVLYMSLNAIGHSNKFAILKSSGEFLRNYITKDSLVGWVNRSIPSITQRKPWNPQPWEENHQVITIKNNIDIIERRFGFNLDRLHLANKVSWSKITKLSTKYLELPKRLGGLGLYKFKGFITQTKLPKINKLGINFNEINVEAKPLSWIDLTKDELIKLNKINLESKVVADDIPGFQGHYHRALMDKYKLLKPIWTKTNLDNAILNVDHKLIPTCINMTKIRKLRHREFFYNETSIWQFLTEYSNVRKVKEMRSLRYYLENYFPQFYKEIKFWEKKGWHRTDAINIVLGDFVIEPTDKINSQLTDIVKLIVWNPKMKNTFGRVKIAKRLSNFTKHASNYLSQQTISTYFRY